MTKLQWTVLVGSTIAMPAGLAMAEMGCSSSSNGASPTVDAGTPDSGAGDATGEDAPTGNDGNAEATLPGATLTWKIQTGTAAGEGDASTTTTPIAGVKVCAYQMAAIPCAMTDASGVFVLAGLPVGTPVALTIDKDGYRSLLAPVLMSATHDETAEPITMTPTNAPDPPIGTAIDWTGKGQVEFFVLGEGAFLVDAGPIGDPGAMVTLAPAGGDGPLFLTDQNTFDASAKTLIDALGAVYNLGAGTYSLTFADSSHDCEPIVAGFGGWGYPGAAAHQVSFPVLAGYTTVAGAYCMPVTPASTDSGAGDTGAKDAGGAD
jgi:hypothetical protein